MVAQGCYPGAIPAARSMSFMILISFYSLREHLEICKIWPCVSLKLCRYMYLIWSSHHAWPQCLFLTYLIPPRRSKQTNFMEKSHSGTKVDGHMGSHCRYI